MNKDILTNIISKYDMNSISVIEMVKITMEIVEKMKDKGGEEKKLIVISILDEFVKIYENSLAFEIKSLIENKLINHIIETFIFASKNKIKLNLNKCNNCCFIT